MTIRTVSRVELKKIAHELFAFVVADIREEIAEIKSEQERHYDSIVTLNTQVTATNRRLENEFERSKKSREAILQRLAEVENAARNVS